MPIPLRLYKNALYKLGYAETVKEKTCALLDRLSDHCLSGMLINARDYDHALACVKEAIDEMFYEEISEAQKIKEEYERSEWRKDLPALGVID